MKREKLKLEVRKYNLSGDYEELESIEINDIKDLAKLGYGTPIEIYDDEYVTEWAFDMLPLHGFNLFKSENTK